MIDPEADDRDARRRYEELWQKREAYDEATAPILKAMSDLKLRFVAPWFIVDPNGDKIAAGERWTNAAAENLYHQYEEALVRLGDIIFNETRHD